MKKFPFNSLEYANTYGGTAVLAPGTPCPVYIDTIPGRNALDGRLPWPYVRLDNAGIRELAKAHSGLVTLTGVTVPDPRVWKPDEVLIQGKQHFLFEPNAVLPSFSRKTRANIRHGQRLWHWSPAVHPDDWICFHKLYKELVKRRALEGSRFDLDAAHFHGLSTLPGARLFGVRNASGWGAMACAMETTDELHLLHIAVSQDGLTNNASYVMMLALLERCLNDGRTLYLGGVPTGDQGGVLRFKQRWSNTTRAAGFLKLILNAELYAGLSIPGNAFFPAYRMSWSYPDPL